MDRPNTRKDPSIRLKLFFVISLVAYRALAGTLVNSELFSTPFGNVTIEEWVKSDGDPPNTPNTWATLKAEDGRTFDTLEGLTRHLRREYFDKVPIAPRFAELYFTPRFKNVFITLAMELAGATGFGVAMAKQFANLLIQPNLLDYFMAGGIGLSGYILTRVLAMANAEKSRGYRLDAGVELFELSHAFSLLSSTLKLRILWSPELASAKATNLRTKDFVPVLKALAQTAEQGELIHVDGDLLQKMKSHSDKLSQTLRNWSDLPIAFQPPGRLRALRNAAEKCSNVFEKMGDGNVDTSPRP